MADVAAMDIVIGSKVDGAQSGLKLVQKGLADTAIAAGKTDSSLQKMNKATSASSNALVNFGRVAQDAAFGPIAIANNLNPLIESLSSAAKQAKETGTSFTQNLLKSLIGGGGLSLAFSAVQAAIGFTVMGLSAWTRGMTGASKTANEAAKAIDGIAESTAREMLKFNELAAIAKDSNISYKTRLEAVKELRETYPSYLKNLSDEQILAGQLKSSYDDINNALFAKATLQAAEEKVIPILRDIVKLRIDENEQLKKVKELTPPPGGPAALRRLTLTKKQSDELKSANADLLATVNERKGLQDKLDKVLQGFYEVLKASPTLDLDKHIKTEKIKKDIDEIAKILDELHKKQSDIQKGVQLGDILKADAAVQDVKALKSAIIDLMNLQLPPSNIINQLLAEWEQKVLPAIGKGIQKTFSKMPDIAPPARPIPVPIVPVMDNQEVKDAITKGQAEIAAATYKFELPVNFKFMSGEEIRDKYQDAIKQAIEVSKLGFKLPKNFFQLSDDDRNKLVKEFEDIGKIVTDTVSGVFITVAENIGNLKNPLAGIFEILGDGLIALGKQVIITSDLVASISKALNAALSGLPGAGIAVGIGLIVAGSLLKHFKPFAEGGIITGPTRALIGEAGPEVVFPLDRLREFIQPAQAQVVVLETRVRGSDIWLSQSRTNERRGRTY
jgi:hypothetical protein